jgi:hypothetical protein
MRPAVSAAPDIGAPLFNDKGLHVLSILRSDARSRETIKPVVDHAP